MTPDGPDGYRVSVTAHTLLKDLTLFPDRLSPEATADEALITDEMVEEWYQSVLDRDYVRFLLRVARATRDWRLTDDLQRLDLPTLIVWGRDDKVTPPAVELVAGVADLGVAQRGGPQVQPQSP